MALRCRKRSCSSVQHLVTNNTDTAKHIDQSSCKMKSHSPVHCMKAKIQIMNLDFFSFKMAGCYCKTKLLVCVQEYWIKGAYMKREI